MLNRFRPQLTYANVVSSIALFAVLGGGAYAASKIGPSDIAKNAVRAKHIKKNQVKAKHVVRNAVRTRKLRDGAVTSAKLAPAARPSWAALNADATIVAQSGGITVSEHLTGLYYLNFGEPVTGRFVSAIPRANSRAIAAVPCGGGSGATNCAPPGTNNANHLLVRVANSTNDALTDNNFSVAVFP